MSGKAFGSATLVGGIVSFVVGYLIWGMLFADFFASNAGTATGVMKDPPDMVPLFLGTLVGAALMTLIIVRWAKASSAGDGLRIGATVGFMISLNMGLVWYGTSNINTMTSMLVDPFLGAVHGGIVGAVIAVVAGKLGSSAG
jgi:hypothetical protein